MKHLMELALEAAKRAGAEYCDVRYIQSQTERIVTKNGHLQSVSQDEDSGYGVRVLKDGAWGFSSSGTGTPQEVTRIAQEAASIAKASARSLGLSGQKPAVLSPIEPISDQWRADPKIDPFEIRIEEKVAELTTAEDLMRKAAEVNLTHGSLNFFKEDKHFMSSEGSDIRQTLTQSGGVIGAMARNQEEAPTSAPTLPVGKRP